jgi:ATP-binding cassette subfamily B protein
MAAGRSESALRSYARVARTVARVQPGRFARLSLLVLVRSATPLGFIIGAAVVVGQVPATADGGFGSAAGHRLLWGLALMGVCFLLQQVLPSMEWLVGDAARHDLRVHFEQELMRLVSDRPDLLAVEDRDIQDRLATAGRESYSWPPPGDAARTLAYKAAEQVVVAGACAMLVTLHWWVGPALLVVLWWFQLSVMSVLVATSDDSYGSSEEARYCAYLLEVGTAPRAAQEVRVFGWGSWLAERYGSTWDRAMAGRKTAVRDHPAVLASTLTVTLSVIGIAVLVGVEAGNGSLSLAQAVLCIQALLMVVQQLTQNQSTQDGVSLARSSASVRAMQRLQSELSELPEHLRGVRDPAGLPAEEIRFERVSFRYPGQQRDVLHDLDLVIPAGTSLAIVGENGAGKTTLVKLLCRFYEPTAGRITVDGVDVRELDPQAWQRRVAGIFQDFVRYPFDADHNVRLGRASDGQTLDDVARATGLAEVVGELPGSWQTVLDSTWSGGVGLSGGQWQRVALARAVHAARTGATVLVLDEPTASLDVRSEAAIYEQFLQVTGSATTLLISHRFASVRRADRICVLEGGRVVELGGHDELLAQRGRYHAMFTVQAGRYADEVGA